MHHRGSPFVIIGCAVSEDQFNRKFTTPWALRSTPHRAEPKEISEALSARMTRSWWRKLAPSGQAGGRSRISADL